jgi:hypothetical protein
MSEPRGEKPREEGGRWKERWKNMVIITTIIHTQYFCHKNRVLMKHKTLNKTDRMVLIFGIILDDLRKRHNSRSSGSSYIL